MVVAGSSLPLQLHLLLQQMLVALVPDGSSVDCREQLDVELGSGTVLLLQHRINLVLLEASSRYVNR